MDQIDRINKYEYILNNSNQIIKNLEKTINDLNNIQSDIKSLNDYYGSSEWYKDIDDDKLGLLPKDINKGILSEDAIYNLLIDNKEVAIEMLEVATNILKNY